MNTSAFVDPRSILSPVSEDSMQLLGGKAANLQALHDAGFPVPPFQVLPVNVFRDFCDHHGLRVDDSPSEEDCITLSAGINTREFPPAIARQIDEIWKKMGSQPLCVRSSGTCEDLAGLSFAGQYETVLDIRSFEAFTKAIRQCWSSLFNKRVRQYLATKKLPYSKAGMALIVQHFLTAEHAGVCFTVNPLTGRQNHCLIEFTQGCGDALVSGQVNPETVIVDHATQQLVSGKLPPDMKMDEVHLFRRIHAHFGSPQDIEWVIADHTLWVVQSRSITSIQAEPSFGTWTTADFRDGGVSSSVCTPFMWSLYDYIWQFSMPEYFRAISLLDPGQEKQPWGGCFFGRPYWNLGEVVRCLLKVPGFHEQNLYSDLGINTATGYRHRSVPFSPGIIYSVLPTIFKLERYYAFRIRRNRRFRQTFADLIKPYDKTVLNTVPGPEFARMFGNLMTDVYFPTETSYFLTIYNASNAKLDFKVHLDAINGEGHDLSYIKLISGLLRVKHLSPLKGLASCAAKIMDVPGLNDIILNTRSAVMDDMLKTHPSGKPILEAMRQFLDEHGYHSSRELDISVPRWKDDHVTVWRLLKTYLRDSDSESVLVHERRQYAMYRAEVGKARQAFSTSWHRLIPLQARLFFKALLRTRNYCWWREEMRDYSSRVYAIIRQYAVEAERRLGLAQGEIFWLTWQQVRDALSGKHSPEQIRTLLAHATEEARMYRLFANPDELGAGFLTQTRGVSEAVSQGHLQGVGCSPGTVEGVARVVPSLENIDRIRRGEILITRFTDPGWTPIFHLIGGVVTETGGVLSHAAVISREYGIPAVLNVGGALQSIKDGQKIRIDGLTGTIDLL
ncbi:MAG: PEP/pyruvate-binding domain-containing protein [Candidatus Ozemobacteraceae bacterium]